MGYKSKRKGWKCCDPTTWRCYISRNLFNEAPCWWPLENTEAEDIKKIEEKVLNKCQEDEQYTVPNFEGPRGTNNFRELEMTDFQEEPESGITMTTSSEIITDMEANKHSNLALIEDIETELRKRSKIKSSVEREC